MSDPIFYRLYVGGLLGIVFGVLCRIAVAADAYGPAESPWEHPDFGGTPDLTFETELSLSLDELRAQLALLSSAELSVRTEAAVEIRRNAVGAEAVFREQLAAERMARNDQIRRVMQQVAGQRSGGEEVMRALLEMEPLDEGVTGTTRIVVMLVALDDLNTLAGYQVLLWFSGRHAGGFRAMLGILFVHSGLNGLPALVYARVSGDRELHMFAVKWIRDMGSPLLSDQVRGLEDSRRLAQLLEAYAAVRELDAIPVTLAMANHDSPFVRRAARKCLARYGRNARWPIHREYQNVFAEDPPSRSASTEWLEALYDAWDSARNADDLTLYSEGVAAGEAGNFVEMDQLFRKLLSRSPLFERRGELATWYLTFSEQLDKAGDVEESARMNRMVLRLADAGSPLYRRAETQFDLLRLEQQRQGGALDLSGYRALSDASGARVDRRLQVYGEAQEGTEVSIWRVVGVSILIFVAMLLVYLRVRHFWIR